MSARELIGQIRQSRVCLPDAIASLIILKRREYHVLCTDSDSGTLNGPHDTRRHGYSIPPRKYTLWDSAVHGTADDFNAAKSALDTSPILNNFSATGLRHF